jgi:hypothetical protein
MIASLLLAAGLAFGVRDIIYDLIVVPLSYLIWQIGGLLRSVAQLVQWGILVIVLSLVLVWQLIPELKRPTRRGSKVLLTAGQIETMALGLLKARSSNYFKWQLAHRLGRVSRRLDEHTGRSHDAGTPSPSVMEYLAAGLNLSFVDFPARRHLFHHPVATALDTDPVEVIGYLEAQWFLNGDNHADRL